MTTKVMRERSSMAMWRYSQPTRSLPLFNAEQGTRSRRQPIHFSTERLFLSRVLGYLNQFPAILFQMDSNPKRIIQILIDDHKIWALLVVFKFAYKKPPNDRRPQSDTMLSRHFDTLNQLAGRKGLPLIRHVRIVVYPGAMQPNQSWRELVNLIIDAAQHVPGRRAIAELIDGRQTKIADLGREVGEILNAASAIGHCAVSLQVKGCVRRLHVIEECVGQDDVPKSCPCFQAEAPDNLKIRVE